MTTRPLLCDGTGCTPATGGWEHRAPCTHLLVEAAAVPAEHERTPLDGHGAAASYAYGLQHHPTH